MIKKATQSLAVLLAFGVTGEVRSDEPCDDNAPVPAFTADYEVHRNGKRIGAAQVSLAYDSNGRATYATHTEGTRGMARLLGVDVSESSTASWINCKYRTEAFQYEQKVAFSNKQQQFTIDWQQLRASGEYKGKPWSIDVEPGYLDSLLVNLQLMTDIALTPEVGTEFTYTVIRNNRVKPYRYKALGQAQVDTPLGPVDTLHVARIRDTSSDRESEVWMDLSRFALPIVIRHVEDGDVLQMRLLNLSFPSDSANGE